MWLKDLGDWFDWIDKNHTEEKEMEYPFGTASWAGVNHPGTGGGEVDDTDSPPPKEIELRRTVDEERDGWDGAAKELVVLLRSKQADYGPENIMSTGHQGLAVRLTDKVARLRNLTLNNKEPKNESLRDTYMDIAGYGIIGMMLIDGRFPDEV